MTDLLRVRRARRRPEDGNVTVVAVGVIGLMLVLTIGGLAVASAVATSHRARSAADLAALAGAQQVPFGLPVDGQSVCHVARDLAIANGAQLTQCTVDGTGVVTVVARAVSNAPWRFSAAAIAKAGPAP